MGPYKSITPTGRRLRRAAWFIFWALVFLIILRNVLVYHHAYSFFHYTHGSERTPSLEEMTWSDKIEVILKGVKIPKPEASATPADRAMPYENVDLPGRDGLTLSGWHIPAGAESAPLVIIFHGYNTEKSGLLPEAQRFHLMGYRVVMVDFPGSGESPGYMVSLGIHEAEDVAKVLAWAREQWPDEAVMLYGHSMGGAAVMRAMAVLGAEPDAAIVESVFDTMLNAVKHRIRLIVNYTFGAAETFLFWSSVHLKANCFEHDVIAYAEHIHTPVLIAHGAKDIRAPIDGARSVKAALQGTSAFLEMPEARHVSPCLSDTNRWDWAVRSFLQEVIQ